MDVIGTAGVDFCCFSCSLLFKGLLGQWHTSGAFHRRGAG
jgi:hypothetical protein